MEERIAKQNRIAELQHMKKLFSDFLPIGEDTSQIDKTFFELEQVIYTKGSSSVKDDFDHQSIIEPCSGSAECDGDGELPREYTYYAPHLSKLQAQRHGRQRKPDPTSSDSKHEHSPQDVEDATSTQRHILPVQNEPSSTGPVSHISEHSDGCDDSEQQPVSDGDDSEGELLSFVFGHKNRNSNVKRGSFRDL